MLDVENPIVVHKRRKHSRKIPFGFDVDPTDPSVLVPDINKYRTIIKARKMRENGATLLECSNIFRMELNHDVFPMDIKRILEREY